MKIITQFTLHDSYMIHSPSIRQHGVIVTYRHKNRIPNGPVSRDRYTIYVAADYRRAENE